MRYTKEKEGDLYGKEKNENVEKNSDYNFFTNINKYNLYGNNSI